MARCLLLSESGLLLCNELHVLGLGHLGVVVLAHAVHVDFAGLVISVELLLLLLHLVHLEASNSLDLGFRELSEVVFGEVLELLGSQADLRKDLLGIEILFLTVS